MRRCGELEAVVVALFVAAQIDRPALPRRLLQTQHTLEEVCRTLEVGREQFDVGELNEIENGLGSR